MGINGLLPCLRSVTRPAHVSAYAGKRVAVDSYVWLHRGVFTCARELALGQTTDKCVARALRQEAHPHVSPCARVRYVAYFVRCVEVLRAAGVEPVCVFDGDKLPSKAVEEAERATCVRANESGGRCYRAAPRPRGADARAPRFVHNTGAVQSTASARRRTSARVRLVAAPER